MPQIGFRDERDDRRFTVEQGLDLRIGVGGGAGLAGRAERDERGVLELQLAFRGPGEEFRVLGQRARPAAFDEPDAQFVQQPRDGQLVLDGVGDALTLRTVAQGRVVEVEGIAEGVSAGSLRVTVCLLDAMAAVSGGSERFQATKKPPAGCERLRAGSSCGAIVRRAR